MTTANAPKYAKVKAEVNEYKVAKGCIVCGYNKRAYNIELHHVDPATKVDSVSNLIHASAAKAKVWAEVAKCVPLCNNCHGEYHNGDISDNELNEYIAKAN